MLLTPWCVAVVMAGRKYEETINVLKACRLLHCATIHRVTDMKKIDGLFVSSSGGGDIFRCFPRFWSTNMCVFCIVCLTVFWWWAYHVESKYGNQ